MDINEKVAIVTGAARGIGKAIVEILLDKGAKGVAILDIIDDVGEETCKTLNEKCGKDKVIYIHCDVSSASDLEVAFRNAIKTFGGLDIVCNNAGIANEFRWEQMMDVNQKGVIRGTYLAMEHMGAKNGGRGGVVINTASFVGVSQFPLLPIYCSTKYAIIGFTRSVANEPRLKENQIKVSAICPGMVYTDLATSCGSRSRYKDTIDAAVSVMSQTPVAKVAAGVVQLIEDAESNGKVLYVATGDPMFLEPQDLAF